MRGAARAAIGPGCRAGFRREALRLPWGARDVSGFGAIVNKAALTALAQAFHFSELIPRRGEAEPRGQLQV